MRIPAAARRALDGWIARRLGDQGKAVRLGYRGIYILPTRAGVGFGVLVLVLWLGSVNYGNSLGYLLTFLLAGLGLIAILHTFRNLLGLTVAAGSPGPVFAGGVARFPVRLADTRGQDRVALALEGGAGGERWTDVPADGEGEAVLEVIAPRRGWLRPGRFALATRFPAGLFRAWSWLDPDWRCLVYPRPEGGAVPEPAVPAVSERDGQDGAGEGDFRGLRRYQSGDPPRHLAWRLYARGQDLHTKQFGERSPTRMWLDWQMVAEMEPEAAIARLTRWVLDAERAGRTYGLRLPGLEVAPGHGPRHRHRCLEALALVRP